MASFPWALLGIAPTADGKAIRSAYAAKIKAMDLDADVEGYAALRDARDAALRMAKTMAAAPAALPDFAPDFASDSAQDTVIEVDDETLALLDGLPVEWDAEPAPSPPASRPTSTPADELAEALTPAFTREDTQGSAEPLLPDLAASLGPPLLQGHDAAAAIAAEALQSPFARLAAMLEAADALDETQALPLLGTVLEAIHWAPIDRQGELEHWLAEQLAEHWPRSAPLLEPATAALGWEREWRRIDARPDVEYLGARLRGQRFTDRVQDKGHRYHRAWAELSRPGKAGLTRHLRANGSDVRGLLAGIRRNFPELEQRFDPQRVASWEKVRSWPTSLLVFGGLIVLGFLISLADGKPEAQHKAYRAAVEEIFGAGNGAEWLNRHQPDLASTLAMRAVNTPDGDIDQPATIAADLALVRERVYLNGRRLTGADFDTTMRLRLALLEAARADGPAACRAMMAKHAPPARTRVSPAIRAQERRFAAQLAERSGLGPPAKALATSATVPPELVHQVLERTGLDKDRIKAAMASDDDPDRCLTTIALLKATLDWQGPERHAILMTL